MNISWNISCFRIPVFFLTLFVLTSCAGEYIPIDKAEMSQLYVVNTVPSDGSTGVKRDLSPAGAVVINFSKAIDERYATADYISFKCNELEVDSKLSLSEDKKVLSIKLKSGILLPERADCKVVISKLIRDSAGLPFYLSPKEVSQSLLEEDGGVRDVVIKDSDTASNNNYKDKRSGEGDYVLYFQTEYLPLIITNISPADKEIIPVDALSSFSGVVISFNKSLNPDSVNMSNFFISDMNAAPLLSEDSKTVTLKPNVVLKEGKDYTVAIMPFVMDTSGILLEKTYTYSFSTGFVLPAVVNTSPANGSTEVDSKINTIKIDFNKDMEPSTINNYTVRLIGVDNYSVRYENRSAFIENFKLLENREYFVEISPLVRDTSGLHLGSAYNFSFKTSYDVPFVKGIFPQDKASGIPVNLKSIDIEFSEDMNFENLNENFFAISPHKDFKIEIKDSRNISLLFTEDFLADNTYTVEVSSLIMDISGIGMEKDFVSTFAIAKSPDNNPPSDILIYFRKIDDPETKSRQGFIIEWKAPADNVVNGTLSGKVKSYRLVYSDSPFDKSEFDNKTQLLGIPSPLAPGEIQNIILYSFVDIENNEVPIVYNRPYYFMLSATDGTNVVYSNLLRAGILTETSRVNVGSKFAGQSLKKIENFNGGELLFIGDTDEKNEKKDNLLTGAVSAQRIENGIMTEVLKLYGEYDMSLFGYAMEVLDLNSDGCDDLAVSAPLDGENREGAVYIFFQTREQNECKYNNEEPLRLTGGIKDSLFGLSLKKIEFNGEESLLVGAPNDGTLNFGAVYIYKNRTDKNQIPIFGDIKISGMNSGDSFGYAVFSANLDGDSCEDTIIAAPDASINSRGKVYIFNSVSGVNGCQFPIFDLNNPSFVLSGETDFARFGSRLYSSDLDGDGKDEILISGKDEVEDRGVVYIRRGNDGQLFKVYGGAGGNFGYSFIEAKDYLKDGCKGQSGNCHDVFVSDVLLKQVYLLEGGVDFSNYNLDNLPQFGLEYNLSSFGHSLLVYEDGLFENLLVSAPYSSHFEDFVSGLFLYR